MKRDQFLRQFGDLQVKQADIIRKKNQDYASEEDAFENMRDMGDLGILTRMQDKMARVKNLLHSRKAMDHPHVIDESIEDTLGDLSNYCNMLILFLRDTEKEGD